MTRACRFIHVPLSPRLGDNEHIDAIAMRPTIVTVQSKERPSQDKACPAGQRAESCFHDLARFKRVVKVEMGESDVNAPVRKVGYIDLSTIQDPDRKARKLLTQGVLTFPFFTIENVDIVDERHIVVGNDNNLPFSSSRDPSRADDNEFVLLEVEAFVKAR